MRRLLVLALVGGCVGAEAVYEDPEGGYMVRYPSGWKIERERGSAVFSGEERDVTVAVTSAPRKESWREKPRDLTSTSQAAAQMLTALPQGKLLSEKRATVGGLRATVLEVGFDHKGKPYRRRQWVLEGPQRIGYLGYTAPVAKWEIAEAVAEVMVQTLELGGGAR
jgi:hypothetical protein